MKDRKKTDDLRKELAEASGLEKYLAENRSSFSLESTANALSRLIEEKGISKAALARESGMSEIYLHQIFAGRRNPSRNRLICLCCGLGATLDETQELLKLSGLAQLYPRIKRDAIIIYGLAHGEDLFEINDRLFSEDEETLF